MTARALHRIRVLNARMDGRPNINSHTTSIFLNNRTRDANQDFHQTHILTMAQYLADQMAKHPWAWAGALLFILPLFLFILLVIRLVIRRISKSGCICTLLRCLCILPLKPPPEEDNENASTETDVELAGLHPQPAPIPSTAPHYTDWLRREAYPRSASEAYRIPALVPFG